MPDVQRRFFTENLRVAGIIGILGLVMLAALHLERRTEQAGEIAIIADITRKTNPIVVRLYSSRLFHSLYRLEAGSRRLYGSLIRIGRPGSSALVAVVLSSEGELEIAHFVASANSRLQEKDESFLSAYVGKDSRNYSADPMPNPGEAASSPENREAPDDFRRILGRLADEIESIEKGLQ